MFKIFIQLGTWWQGIMHFKIGAFRIRSTQWLGIFMKFGMVIKPN